MLIVRDCIKALAMQVLVEGVAPCLHEIPLSLALLGSVCKPKNGERTFTQVMETHITIHRGRIRELRNAFTEVSPKDLVRDIFARKDDDDLPGLSQDHQTFLEKMRTETCFTAEGNLQLPLPIMNVKLPNNTVSALMRTKNTLINLRKNPREVALCEQAMQKHLDANHVEQFTDDELNCHPGSVWYIPVFCVEEVRKNKVRVVFDASGKYRVITLNSAFYQGPDLTNGFRGVLLRIRESPVAFGGDIESMFCAFKVPHEQENIFLRDFPGFLRESTSIIIDDPNISFDKGLGPVKRSFKDSPRWTKYRTGMQISILINYTELQNTAINQYRIYTINNNTKSIRLDVAVQYQTYFFVLQLQFNQVFNKSNNQKYYSVLQ